MPSAQLSSLPPDRLRGRRVVVRADLNVPFGPDGRVADDTRLRASVPTLRHLVDAGARVVLLSHLGRPKGAPDPAYSLEPLVEPLAELSGLPVDFCPELDGPRARAAVDALQPGRILLMENTRFHAGETTNGDALASVLASYGDLFVNDAFGSAHRAHASTAGVAEQIRAAGGSAVAGFLMERELRFLGDALRDPERPFVAVLGGAKISGKIDVVEALLPRVDRLLVGGAMANTFFLALGLEVGDSLVEPERVEMARELMERGGERLVLPVDCVVAKRLDDDAATRTAARDAIRPGERVGDIGPDTVSLFGEAVRGARTVLWNGPMGVFERAPFRAGTVAIALAAAAATDGGALTVVGGGDSAAALDDAGVTDRIAHVSTGGGASLEFLAGVPLPGVEALSPPEDG
jgi:phosphoglycerate kinase